MTNLKETIEEIERMGKIYRSVDDKNTRKAYNQYVELIITDADKYEQYRLCDYWEKIKNG